MGYPTEPYNTKLAKWFDTQASGGSEKVSLKIRLVGKPMINADAVQLLLYDLGVEDWEFGNDRLGFPPTDADKLIELAGRLCYKAFGTELNPNITRVRDDIRAYIANIINSGHGSVLEHIHVSFVLVNVSRILTHELVRHRHGNFSQESMRFVRLDGTMRHRGWPKIYDRAYDLGIADEVEERCTEVMQLLAAHQAWLSEKLKVDELSFHEKKEITSDMRAFAPHGVATNIMWTSNFRELRHVITARTDPAAEWEIRKAFHELASQMKSLFPIAFADLQPDWLSGFDGVAHWKSSLRDKV